MNQTLRDAFARQLDEAGRLDVDIPALVDRGEARLRRRRLAALLGATAAVILVIAIGIAAQNDTGTPRPGPVDGPPQRDETPSTRQLVYSDVHSVPGRPDSLLGDPIHVGDRVVKTGSGWIHMDVTDDGVVYSTGGYTDDGRVWFTDGGTPEQIGSHACVQLHGWPRTVVTGNSGSLAAWFDCTRDHHAELVVFDTGSGREVVRRQVPRCSNASAWYGPCLPAAIIGDRVYLSQGDGDPAYITQDGVLLSSGGEAAARALAQDIRNNPRGLVIGDSWETGTPTLFGEFAVVGRRLVPSGDGPPTSVFDTATRQPVRLHLPSGYESDPDRLGGVVFGIFEWLDDDTVALRGGGRQGGDILTCRLSSGRCELAVPGPGYERVVPNQGLW